MNEKAFSLLEVLFSLLMMTMLLFAILSIYLLYKKEENHVYISSLLQNQSSAFVHSIEREIYNGSQFMINNGKLSFYDAAGNLITYEKWGDGVRRQVNHSGHVLLIKDVESISFQMIGNCCHVQYTLKRGEIRLKGEVFFTSRVER
jgi:competence protein ComGF